MPCCQCCCGGVTCAEGQQGKCCCGGPGGTCCQAGEYCCGGVCRASPCDCLSPICEPGGGGWTGSPVNPGALFDGDVSTFSGINGANFALTYTFAGGGLSVQPTVKVFVVLGATTSQVGNASNLVLVNGTDVTQKIKNEGLYLTGGWVDVTSEVGSTFSTISLNGFTGVSNPGISAVSVAGCIVTNCNPLP